METENLVNHETSRMTAFQILSDCFFLPDPGLSEKLEDLEVNITNVCETAVPLVQNMRKEFKACADLETLKVDFAKLFVGPYQFPAAPYGSVYLEGEWKMMGNSTIDVRKRYRDAGLDTAKTFKNAPDHISAELEFMHYLIYKEIEAFANSDIEMAIAFIQRQKSFLEDHLMAWVPEFAGNVVENAKTSFYRNLGRATEVFIKDDYHIITSVLTSWSANTDKSAQAESFSAQY